MEILHYCNLSNGIKLKVSNVINSYDNLLKIIQFL